MLTVNNPAGGDGNDYSVYFIVNEHLRFAKWQLERGEERGTLHLQCYLELKKATAKSKIIRLYPGADVRACRGTQAQCLTYVSKPETRVSGPWEIGVKSAPGTRTDLLGLRDEVKSGKTNVEIMDNDRFFGPYSRLYRFVAHMRLEYAVPRNFMTRVLVFWGSTGIGKSRLAHELFPNAFYFSNVKGAWFDGYDGVSDIIFDDFYGNIPRHQWLQLCDRYPCKVESKGGMINFAPKNVVFTSNKPPWKWYGSNEEFNHALWEPIERRIAETYTDPLPPVSDLQVIEQ